MQPVYEKKLRQLFTTAEDKAQNALDNGDVTTAASYYEQCANILEEQAKRRRGEARKRKLELADEYYDLRDSLLQENIPLQPQQQQARGPVEEQPQQQQTQETDFADHVERFVQDSTVSWDDVAGMEDTKQQLKSSFALAAIEDKPPAVESLHSILLYGPPGTGKSLMASAVAGSHDFTFFNVQLSQALSKYYGESEKIISETFAAARARSPSIVFFDELDAVAMSRGGDMDEVSRRVLSTLLTELSGFDAQNDDILFMAATNAPWDIDPAILSRMERVIYVPLPGVETARRIIHLNTTESGIGLALDVDELAETCVELGYSGREIKSICMEATRNMVDRENRKLEELSERSIDAIANYDLRTRPLEASDFETAFDAVNPKTSQHALQQYEDWEKSF